MGKRNKLCILERKKIPFGETIKPALMSCELPEPGQGAWLVRSPDLSSSSEQSWAGQTKVHAMAGPARWPGSAVRSSDSGRCCAVSALPGWSDAWRGNGVRLFWWMQPRDAPCLPAPWKLRCCSKDCYKKGFSSETILYV